MLTIYHNGCFTYPYEYRGEGNAHLALSLQKENKILLIKKQSVNDLSNDEEKWNNSINFHNNIMCILLEPFVSKVHKVKIDARDIQQIETNIATIRPPFRQNNVLSTICAALMHDYTHLQLANRVYENLPTISFEIKPKCPIDIDNKCKFCNKQKKKLQSGRIVRVTKYCPKDLYSGDIKRMQEAVLNLLKNPQNNIQIYKNSKLIYSDQHDMQELDKTFAYWDSKNPTSTIVNVIVEILNYNYQSQCNWHEKSTTFTVLERLKQLQELDNSNNPPVTNDRGYVNLLLTAIADIKSDQLSKGELISHITSPLSSHYLSKIVRDCSFMISVKQLPPNSDFGDTDMKYVCVNGIYYVFDVKVFDLFPKDEIK